MDTITDTTPDYTTPNGNGVSIVLAGIADGSTQRITSNGAWDTIDLNGYPLYAHVMRGASFNGRGGILTEDGPGNVYLAGTYAGLYTTLNNNSSANVNIAGYGAITNNSSNTSNQYAVIITGDHAGVTVSGTGSTQIVGTYNGLNFADVQTNDRIYASGVGNNFLGTDGGSIDFTQGTGTLTIQGISQKGTVSTIHGSGTDAHLVLSGDTQNINIMGHWASLSGIISSNVWAASATYDSVDIYNTYTQGVGFIGTGKGDLKYNGISHAGATFMGNWANVTATLQGTDNFRGDTTTSGDTYLTLNGAHTQYNTTASAGHTSITQENGSSIKDGSTLAGGDNTITHVDDQESTTITLGTGHTTLNTQSGDQALLTMGSGNLDINYTVTASTRNSFTTVNTIGSGTAKILITNTDQAQVIISKDHITLNHNGAWNIIQATHSGGTGAISVIPTQNSGQILAVFS